MGAVKAVYRDDDQRLPSVVKNSVEAVSLICEDFTRFPNPRPGFLRYPRELDSYEDGT